MYDIKEAALNLGFKVIGNPDDRKKGGDALVNMKEQNNLIKHLSLAYYGNQLSVYFKAESIIAHSISYQLKINKKPVSLEQIANTASVISDIFKNEFMPSLQILDIDKIKSIMQVTVKRGWYTMNSEGSFSLSDNPLSMQIHELFRSLLQSYIDSYLIVGVAINALMETGIVIEKNKIVNELHICIQEIFHSNGIKFMNSCLIEVLNTAFSRFSELGICKSQTYDSQNGGKTIYLKSDPKNKDNIERYLTILSDLSSTDEKGTQTMEE